MNLSLKGVFDKHFANLKVDSRWVREIVRAEQSFLFSRSENLEFLGSPYVGYPKFIFTQAQRENFMYEVMGLDDDTSLKEDYTNLAENSKNGAIAWAYEVDMGNAAWSLLIDPTHKVRSDTYTLVLLYGVHRLMSSKLSSKDIQAGTRALVKLIHYRFLSSLMNHYFPHGVKQEIAEGTYYSLNNRFSIKRFGSWMRLIEDRVDAILSKGNIHYKRLYTFANDLPYVNSDSQGRIRSVIQKIYPKFLEVHSNKNYVKRRSAMFEGSEGDMVIRDTIRKQTQLSRYIHDQLGIRESFIKDELTDVIQDLVSAAPERHFKATLEYISENQGRRGDKRIEALVDEILLHLFTHMNKSNERSMSLSATIKQLKALYSSNRSKDPSLLQIRALGESLVVRATRITNPSTIAAVRTAVCMYIVLRTLTMEHYRA